MNDTILRILEAARPESDFSASTDFISDGMLDSFDMVVLIGELEQQFGVEIDGTDIVPENFMSVDAIAALVAASRPRA